MKVYVAGPMTGIKQYNFPAFHEAARQLRSMGHEVFSPAELNIWDGKSTVDSGTLTDRLRIIVNANMQFLINKAEMIVLLPGWEKSLGAQAEWAVAKALGLKIIYWNE